MKKWLLLALAFAGLGAFPDVSEAGIFRRRARPAPVCQPVVVCPPVAAPWIMPVPVRPLEPTRTVEIEGVVTELIDTGETDEKRDEVEPGLKEAGTSDIPNHARFKGTARRVAKTTIFVTDAAPTPFTNVSALIMSLPPDQTMVGLNIPHGPNSNRVEQEKKNVVVTTFIYAYSKENDNDYHVIIGDPPTVPVANRKYMNVEISGIPVGGTNDNRMQLWAVRDVFRAKYQLGVNGPNSYVRPNPPTPVRITGSLFYDIDHPPPHFVGPQSHKPKTAWEIHPISKLEFLPPNK